ncbi:16S rRNA (guanine(966)-N(2))-methyltransferase RsmD [Halomonas sp. HP20-15]|uniref:16S rRNA (guanine(966)-N(2))-methyltransferase RsmD n=1 Tax=Halomonas sp. HP20-15 TaxID=3085901 RepID=UPI002981CF4B|nr:16S rRNA (guanine(966)-N(2))-methyltransferase RsmD [Halomonas sp. HP20-15]MDW5376274.1 16S rRNA (guanine(966)-N(2))-methyltransferase RsmD [Halomonas sp. HP20-15]
MSRHRSRPPSRRGRPSQPAAKRGARTPGKLRIIGGQFRRRQLPIADSPGLRPTPDRVRETLFNWLAFELAGGRVLDLYAGTGALGLEALSRGAREAIFVESAAPVARTIEDNLATLGIAGRVVDSEVMTFLAGPATPFEVVFLDPPFRQQRVAPTCRALEDAGWLSDPAWVYVEQEAQAPVEVPDNWTLHRQVVAGDTHGRLYRRLASPPGDACRAPDHGVR